MEFDTNRNGHSKVNIISIVCTCVAGFLYGAVSHGISGVIAIHLEKRYSYTSLYSGIIMTGNDIAAIFLGPFTGFYCKKKYCIQWIGLGTIFVSIGCLLFSLPHSMTSNYTPKSTETSTNSIFCNQEKIKICNSVYDYSNGAVYVTTGVIIFILYIGQLLIGIGGTLINIFGLIYIDDSFTTDFSSSILLLWYISHYSGPLFGLIIGSSALKRWIDYPHNALVDMNHTAWLGAWWLPYRIIGIIILIPGTILIKKPLTIIVKYCVSFPFNSIKNKNLSKNTLNIHPKIVIPKQIVEKMPFLKKSSTTSKLNENNEKTKTNSFYFSIKNIVYNPLFIFSIHGHMSLCIVMFGIISFLPKILLILFDIPPSESGLIIAISAGGSAFAGVLFVSNLIKCLEIKRKLRFITLLCTFVTLCIVGHGFIYYTKIGCINHSIVDFSENICSSACHCPMIFDPICGSDGQTYFSPCTAGCKKEISTKNMLQKCLCYNQTIKSSHTITTTKHPHMGFCKKKCYHFSIFIVIICFLSFIGVLAATFQNSIVLRCVSSTEKAVALAVQSSIVKLCSILPSPIFTGYLIDRSCKKWVHTGHMDDSLYCYYIGSRVCQSYDIIKLKKYFSRFSIGFGFFGSVMYVLAFFTSKSILDV